MQVFSTRLSIVFVVLTAAAAPTFASNYTEVDSRPIARVNALSRAAVDAEARAWTRSAAPNGYIGSSRQLATPVDAKSRAEVAADTSKWVRSGLAMIEHRQVGTVVR